MVERVVADTRRGSAKRIARVRLATALRRVRSDLSRRCIDSAACPGRLGAGLLRASSSAG